MKTKHQTKSVFLMLAALAGPLLTVGSPASAKSCNAHSANGQGGLNCGPAPIVSNSQATGQVTGTKPGQVGAPTIGTSNQNPSAKPPTTTVPVLPKAPVDGPKADPVLATPPQPPQVSPDSPLSPPVVVPGVVNIVAPPLTPQFVPHPVVMVAPPVVPQQTPMLIPPLVPQATPMAVPPLLPQATPMAVPPLLPQQTPMAVPPLVQQQTPMLIPPVGTPQQAPMAIPPMVPQQTPVLVPVPVTMKVPPKVGGAPPPSPQAKPVPAKVVTIISAPIQPDGYVTPRPKPNSQSSGKVATPVASVAPIAAPVLVVTPEAATASRNEKMITVDPGRQAASNYPTFSVDSATPNRVCVVSGLERRRTVEPNGTSTYQGTLPTFRMVAAEVADLPAWHPLDSGCVISVTHKR